MAANIGGTGRRRLAPPATRGAASSSAGVSARRHCWHSAVAAAPEPIWCWRPLSRTSDGRRPVNHFSRSPPRLRHPRRLCVIKPSRRFEVTQQPVLSGPYCPHSGSPTETEPPSGSRHQRSRTIARLSSVVLDRHHGWPCGAVMRQIAGTIAPETELAADARAATTATTRPPCYRAVPAVTLFRRHVDATWRSSRLRPATASRRFTDDRHIRLRELSPPRRRWRSPGQYCYSVGRGRPRHARD